MVAIDQGSQALPNCGPIPRQRRKRREGFSALRRRCAKEQPHPVRPPRPSAVTRVPHRRPKGNATLSRTRVRETLQTAHEEDGGEEREPARDKPAQSPGNVPPQGAEAPTRRANARGCGPRSVRRSARSAAGHEQATRRGRRPIHNQQDRDSGPKPSRRVRGPAGVGRKTSLHRHGGLAEAATRPASGPRPPPSPSMGGASRPRPGLRKNVQQAGRPTGRSVVGRRSLGGRQRQGSRRRRWPPRRPGRRRQRRRRRASRRSRPRHEARSSSRGRRQERAGRHGHVRVRRV